MSDIAIRVEELGKWYSLVPPEQRRVLLREALSRGARTAVRALTSPVRHARERRAAREGIWALRDVTFEVRRGETIGLVGGNGAGKSTLLKVLSRITEPTTGNAWIRGRVGSLLEVGTGFHPELTGRENTYLSGAILGMRRAEIDRQFDEIVAFAGVEKFIDVPVKRYSSGMYLRLAFAVAAHLEPDILIVDEVLAVGDATFQRRCLARMSEVARSGRTVLFVSHNMDAVQRLCARSLLLQDGRVIAWGESRDVVARYLSGRTEGSGPESWIDVSALPRTGSGEVRFVAVHYGSRGHPAGHAWSGGPLRFDLLLESDAPRRVDSMTLSLATPGGTVLVEASTLGRAAALELRPGRNRVRLELEELPLNPGTYAVTLGLGQYFGAAYDRLEPAFEIEVVPAESGDGEVVGSGGLVPCRFTVSQPADPDAPEPAAHLAFPSA